MSAAEQANGRADVAGVQYLRGFAALMVVIYHLSWQVNGAIGIDALVSLKSGVDIFFVISGFVMMYSTAGGTNTGASFFLRRRLARIVPLYWATTFAMIAILLVAPRLVQSARLEPLHTVASIFFLPALSPVMPTEYRPLIVPGWTLNLEMTFYAIFTLAILFGRGRPFRVFAFASGVLLLLAALGLARLVGGTAGFYTQPVILEFVYGMAIGYALLHGRLRRGWLALPFALIAVPILLLPEVGDELHRGFRFGIPALVIVLAAVTVPLPRIRALHLLGDSSYSLYLSHFFTLSVTAQVWKRLHLFDKPFGVVGFYLVSVPVAIIVGLLCWRLVERPLTRATTRLIAPRRPLEAATA